MTKKTYQIQIALKGFKPKIWRILLIQSDLLLADFHKIIQTSAMEAIAKSDAPYWGAVEWLPMGAITQTEWDESFQNSLAIPRLRYIQVRNWRSIKNNQKAIKAIQNIIQ